MDSVPSSISFAELASYLNQDPLPVDQDSVDGDFSRQELELIAEDAISGAIEIVPDPMIHKVISIIAFGESAGRARAAAELSRQGYHEEAKNLMLGKDAR